MGATRDPLGRSGLAFWLLTIFGWLFGFVALFAPNQQPFAAFAIVAGVLLIAAGVIVLFDGGRAIGIVTERYAQWLSASGTRSSAVGILAIGAGWLFAGVYLTIH
ncbi:MAG: hypothetical protein ACLP50_34730 [Solirubrobacteraceae bacterium]